MAVDFRTIRPAAICRVGFAMVLGMATACVGPPAPEQVAANLGLDRYRGAIDPEVISTDGDETVYTFDPEQGPVCMRGDPYYVSVRDSGSEDLVIFLQSGGACWSAFCLAVTKATQGVMSVDVLDPDLEINPVRDWNAVYLPYCDGSFFGGDAEYDDNLNDKGPRYHRGLANLTAALEVAAARFPSPRRILLAGSSGGAYGLMPAGPLTRSYFPDAELIVMADSGGGLGRDGDADYLRLVLQEHRMAAFLPDDCDDCVVSGHLTPMVPWWLARDPEVRMGLYSSWHDGVLVRVFLQVSDDSFANALAEQSDAIHNAFPDRFRRFINDGIQHTSILGGAGEIFGENMDAVEIPPEALVSLFNGDLLVRGLGGTRIGEVTMADWLGALVEGDLDAWTDLREERGSTEEPE